MSRWKDEVGPLPTRMDPTWWALPMGGGGDDANRFAWDEVRSTVRRSVARAYPRFWGALTEEGRRRCELEVSRALLCWMATWAFWEDPRFARAWEERDTVPRRAFSALQLALILRMDAPPVLPACVAYLEHVRRCSAAAEGCVLGDVDVSECGAARELLAAAEEEYYAQPAGERPGGWTARM